MDYREFYEKRAYIRLISEFWSDMWTEGDEVNILNLDYAPHNQGEKFLLVQILKRWDRERGILPRLGLERGYVVRSCCPLVVGKLKYIEFEDKISHLRTKYGDFLADVTDEDLLGRQVTLTKVQIIKKLF